MFSQYIALKEYLGYQGLLDKLTSGMEEIEAGFSWFFDFIVRFFWRTLLRDDQSIPEARRNAFGAETRMQCI